MKPFYGWVIVGVGIVVTCVGMGAMTSLAVFLQPMSHAMGWSRTGIATAALLNFLSMAAGAFAWGALSDRFGTRLVILCGGALLGTGLVTASRAATLGWFQVLFGVLVYTLMVASWNAGQAGMLAVGVTFLVGMLQKETRPTWAGVVDCLESSGRTMLDLVAITAMAGLVIGALQLSGFVSKLPLLLISMAGGNLLLLLVLTALVSIVLGMSLPTTVVYVTLAVLVGPALAQLGIVPLAAHLFLFYFGMLSLITPPDCLATYAAAAIAKSDFWQTGWAGMRLGIVAYIVPFVFVYHPALIGRGSLAEIVGAVATASVGVTLLGVACAGYWFRPLGWGRRGWAIAAALFFILPPMPGLPELAADAIGLGLGASLLLVEWIATSPKRVRMPA